MYLYGANDSVAHTVGFSFDNHRDLAAATAFFARRLSAMAVPQRIVRQSDKPGGHRLLRP
ncbi:hypothetical protein [Mesorhizobium sp. M0323]|uniref:hypothetical protein n=1 Tax=Mesorhizobium sp. M0323 TaxID=2956938 RepID=UPI003338043E